MDDDIKRVVVKVGTNVLTNKDNRILGPVLRELVRQIAVLYERDVMVVLVSSGSAIAGKEVLGDMNITEDRKSTRLNSSHVRISYAVFCLKKKKKKPTVYIIDALLHCIIGLCKSS